MSRSRRAPVSAKSSSQRRRRRKAKASNAVVRIVFGVLGGVVLLGAVVAVIVSTSGSGDGETAGDDSPPTTNPWLSALTPDGSDGPDANGGAGGDTYVPWGEDPIDPRITVTTTNWQPDPTIVGNHVGEDISGHRLRTPHGFTAKLNRTQDDMFLMRQTPFGKVEVFHLERAAADAPTSGQLEQMILRGRDELISAERGRLRGLPAYRVAKNFRQGGAVLYGVVYWVIEHDMCIGVRFITPRPAESPEVEAMEHALRTIEPQ